MGIRGKISLATAMLLAVLLLAVACSQQESDEEAGSQKVVVKINPPPANEKHAAKAKEGQIPRALHNSQPPQGNIAPQPEELPKAATTETILVSQELPEIVEPANQEGWYRTGEKDTLIVLAGSSRIYSDPYKWISLLRLNLKALEPFGLDKGIENRELPQGLGLRFLTPKEAAQRRDEIKGHKWVVNILSDKDSRRISGLAVRLVKNGIPVYIAKAQIKGQQWMRLRVGFFATASEAKQMKDKLEEMLGVSGLWLDKITEDEFNNYAGY